MWQIGSPRYFLWFIAGAFCFSPEGDPLSLMKMQTQCCWCGISESLSSRVDFFFLMFSRQNPVRVFSAIRFPGEIWPGFSPMPAPGPHGQNICERREKIVLFWEQSWGRQHLTASEFFHGQQLCSSSLNLPDGTCDRNCVRILNPSGFNEENSKSRLMGFLQQFPFWWILTSTAFYLV